jgi:hypothetical protein
VGSLLISTICHYCGGRADTQDHIIPRCDLPPLILLPPWFRNHLVVPACKGCNGEKGPYRSDCTCDHCEWVWGTALGEGFLRPGYMPRGYVSIAHNGWLVEVG